ncbi:MAG: hypothetical protein HXS45_13500 [Theionarchaea archaeon]|nr:hypothetical protein [Theionarchaea archaeon]
MNPKRMYPMGNLTPGGTDLEPQSQQTLNPSGTCENWAWLCGAISLGGAGDV